MNKYTISQYIENYISQNIEYGMSVLAERPYVCITVSSMLPGLETRSLGLNTLDTSSLQSRHSLSKSVVRPRLPGFNQY